jgi:hypothetical protein
VSTDLENSDAKQGMKISAKISRGTFQIGAMRVSPMLQGLASSRRQPFSAVVDSLVPNNSSVYPIQHALIPLASFVLGTRSLDRIDMHSLMPPVGERLYLVPSYPSSFLSHSSLLQHPFPHLDYDEFSLPTDDLSDDSPLDLRSPAHMPFYLSS